MFSSCTGGGLEEKGVTDMQEISCPGLLLSCHAWRDAASARTEGSHALGPSQAGEGGAAVGVHCLQGLALGPKPESGGCWEGPASLGSPAWLGAGGDLPRCGVFDCSGRNSTALRGASSRLCWAGPKDLRFLLLPSFPLKHLFWPFRFCEFR